jgi:hypothetical protein
VTQTDVTGGAARLAATIRLGTAMNNKLTQADWEKLRRINIVLKYEGQPYRARMATPEEAATGKGKNGDRVVNRDGLAVVLCPVVERPRPAGS